jgi:hypothetical protein
MFFEVLSVTYHSPITIDAVTCRFTAVNDHAIDVAAEHGSRIRSVHRVEPLRWRGPFRAVCATAFTSAFALRATAGQGGGQLLTAA